MISKDRSKVSRSREECIFCKIIKGDIGCSKIYEDDRVFAFLDINPASKHGGHTLVMPKSHYKLISEVNEKDLAAVSFAIKKIGAALLKFGKGLNVLQNNERIAGQIVEHVHFHLIPRFEGDNIRISYWEGNRLSSEEMDEVRRKIISFLK